MLSDLSDDVLAGQVLVVGYRGADVPPSLRAALEDGSIGGIVLFKRNIASVTDVHRVLKELAHHPARPPMVAVDQEGGRVARLGPPVLKLPPMATLGAIGQVDLTFRLAAVLGRQLRQLGFNTDFAPVLDVNTNPANPVIGDRAFGSDVTTVIEHALAFARGLANAGIIACGKHFPGHGDTDLDSHLALPRLSHDRRRLDEVELRPFAAASEIPSIMTAHVVFEAIEPSRPATLSPDALRILRDDLGYRGVVISDDLEMKAVAERHRIEESAQLAISAGCDAALICSDLDAAWRTRDRLAERAATDPRFKTRLQEAAAHFLTLRRGFAPSPSQTLNDGDLVDETAQEASRQLAAAIAKLNS